MLVWSTHGKIIIISTGGFLGHQSNAHRGHGGNRLREVSGLDEQTENWVTYTNSAMIVSSHNTLFCVPGVTGYILMSTC